MSTAAVHDGLVYISELGGFLQCLDAATGKQLYTSGDTIHTYSRLAGMSVGDGHVFFTTHDNTLYSFGVYLER